MKAGAKAMLSSSQWMPQVAIICLSEDRLQKIAVAVSGSLGAEVATRVVFFQPDQFIAHLKTLPVTIPQDATVSRAQDRAGTPASA